MSSLLSLVHTRPLVLTNTCDALTNTQHSSFPPITHRRPQTQKKNLETNQNGFLPRLGRLSIWRGVVWRCWQWPFHHKFSVSRSVYHSHTEGKHVLLHYIMCLFIIHKFLLQAASQNNASFYGKLGSRNKSKVWHSGFCGKQRGNAQGWVYKILSGNISFSPAPPTLFLNNTSVEQTEHARNIMYNLVLST